MVNRWIVVGRATTRSCETTQKRSQQTSKSNNKLQQQQQQQIEIITAEQKQT